MGGQSLGLHFPDTAEDRASFLQVLRLEGGLDSFGGRSVSIQQTESVRGVDQLEEGLVVVGVVGAPVETAAPNSNASELCQELWLHHPVVCVLGPRVWEVQVEGAAGTCRHPISQQVQRF